MPTKTKKAATTANVAEQKLETVLRRLREAREVCIDTETSGLDWRTNHIVGYVYTFGPAPQDSYYLPFRHAGKGNIGGEPGPLDPKGWKGELHRAEVELLKLTDCQGKTIFGHNLNFDLKFLWRADVRKHDARFEDTIINAALLDEWQGRYSLEFCANKAKVAAKKGAEMYSYLAAKFGLPNDHNTMGHYWRLDGDDKMGVEYAEGDGTSTWQLRDWQMAGIHEQNLTIVHDIESRLIPVLVRMSCIGIKIDEEALYALSREIHERLDILSSKLPVDFNARSGSDVMKYMRDHGITDWPMTAPSKRFPEGQPSFPEEWLKKSEPGRQIVEVRKLMTLDSTFVQPMINTHLYKGRVHTTFNQLRSDQYGTVTGRLSSSDPNLQAVPKHDETTGKMFRRIFVPDEGKIWGSVDYSQCEPRLLAFYSRCKVLIQGYTSVPPVDAHTAVAVAANPNWNSLSKAEQKHYRNAYAKRINQTIITGGGKSVIVQKYGVPADEVDRVWNDYHRAMPEIRQLQKRASRVMRTRGYVISLLGRRARLINPNMDYTAVNRLLQCGNADIIKDKMVACDDYLKSEGRPIDMLNNIHDSVDYQFSPEHRKHYEKCLEIMQSFGPEDRITLDIPITVDADEGPNWAVATYGEE